MILDIIKGNSYKLTSSVLRLSHHTSKTAFICCIKKWKRWWFM